MQIYFLGYTILFVFAGLARSLKRKDESKYNKALFVVSSIVVVLILGLRHPSMGNDLRYQSPNGYLQQRQKSLELLQNRLIAAQSQCINRNNQRYIALTAKLDAMSPLKVLSRGYAIAQTEENTVVRSVSQVQCGDQLYISFSDGTLSATVTDVKENRK